MKQTRLMMGMPITIEVSDASAEVQAFDKVFAYFAMVDETFSTYKEHSEISRINKGILRKEDWSADMRTIMALAEETKRATNGYFDITTPDGGLDPSGIVKGWAIQGAALLLDKEGYEHFYVDVGGDVQSRGTNPDGAPWSVGIRNPWNDQEIIKVVNLEGEGIATSGTYIRGQHIYNPHSASEAITDIISLSVIGPNVYEADRFATAAFAMGKSGIDFIERLPGLEGYVVDKDGIATMTSGFDQYTLIRHAHAPVH